MPDPSATSQEQTVIRLVAGRRGKPGALQTELATAIIPILEKHRGTFGTKDQVAGCAISILRDCVNTVIYQR